MISASIYIGKRIGNACRLIRLIYDNGHYTCSHPHITIGAVFKQLCSFILRNADGAGDPNKNQLRHINAFSLRLLTSMRTEVSLTTKVSFLHLVAGEES